MARQKAKKSSEADDSVQILEEDHNVGVRTSPRKRKPLSRAVNIQPVKEENPKPKRTKRKDKQNGRATSPPPPPPPAKKLPVPSEDTAAMIKSFRESSRSLSGTPETTFKKPNRTITAEEILRAGTDDLVALVNSLVNTSHDDATQKYINTCKLQMANDAKLIAQLQSELEKKLQSVDTLTFQLQRYQSHLHPATPQKRKTSDMYQLPIRNGTSSSSLMIHQDELAQELKTIGITLDMLELLTGVRIINYEEDLGKYYFDVKQSSTNSDNDNEAITVDYRLVIKKQFEESADVNYVPVFLTDSSSDNHDTERLIAHLPDYLRDNLIFPYNTLSQFYAKMNKALNKAAKS